MPDEQRSLAPAAHLPTTQMPEPSIPLAALSRLSARMTSLLPNSGDQILRLGSIRLIRREPGPARHDLVTRPSIALVVSGEKEAVMLNSIVRYGAGSVFVCGVNMPDSFRILPSSKPFLGISIDLDQEVVDRALIRLNDAPSGFHRVASVFEADDGLIDVFGRLVELRDHTSAERALRKLYEEEAALRVLASPGGQALRTLFQTGSVENRIRLAALWIGEHYRESFTMKALAKDAQLSEAAFYRQFKAVLGVTPRQYAQTLRLYEAKRLMLEEKLDAVQASLEVGYASLSFFTRSYKRFFGASPRRHVSTLRSPSAPPVPPPAA